MAFFAAGRAFFAPLLFEHCENMLAESGLLKRTAHYPLRRDDPSGGERGREIGAAYIA
jgi:hypothetical protein